MRAVWLVDMFLFLSFSFSLVDMFLSPPSPPSLPSSLLPHAPLPPPALSIHPLALPPLILSPSPLSRVFFSQDLSALSLSLYLSTFRSLSLMGDRALG